MILYAGSAGIAILFPDVISAFAFVGGTGGRYPADQAGRAGGVEGQVRTFVCTLGNRIAYRLYPRYVNNVGR